MNIPTRLKAMARPTTTMFTLAVLEVLSVGLEAREVVPYSDAELVRSDVIVVAKCVNPEEILCERRQCVSPFRISRTLYFHKDFRIISRESFLDIEVLRVLKGRIHIGKLRIMKDPVIHFPPKEKGQRILVQAPGTTAPYRGEIQDVRVPAIWFLSWQESGIWKKKFLTLMEFRSIQPLSRLGVFEKLLKKLNSLEEKSDGHGNTPKLRNPYFAPGFPHLIMNKE